LLFQKIESNSTWTSEERSRLPLSATSADVITAPSCTRWSLALVARASTWGNEHRQPRGHRRSFWLHFHIFSVCPNRAPAAPCTTRPGVVPPTQLAACAKVTDSRVLSYALGVHPMSSTPCRRLFMVAANANKVRPTRTAAIEEEKEKKKNPGTHCAAKATTTIHCSHARQDRASAPSPWSALYTLDRLAQMALATLGRLGRRCVCGECGRC
jgi:hypothetical protein